MQTLHKIGVTGLMLAFLATSSPTAIAQQADASDSALPSLTDIQKVVETASADDEARFRARVRAYLLEHPEVLVEAMQVLEQRRMVEEVENERTLVSRFEGSIFDDGFSYVGGNPEGSITVVEFQDYRCGYCKRAHGEIQELISADGDIRLIVKEFPILGPDSMTTSRLAIATMITQGSDAYKRISDALMTFAGPINDSSLDRLARSADIDLAAAQAVMDSDEVNRRIAETRDLGQNLSISGTPTFIVGEKLVRGYLPLAEMQRVVQLSRAGQ